MEFKKCEHCGEQIHIRSKKCPFCNEVVEENPATTFNLNDSTESVPAWVKAIQRVQNSKNI